MDRNFHMSDESEFMIRNLKFQPPSLKKIKLQDVEIEYTANKLIIGLENKNKTFSLNMEESIRGTLLGNPGCLEKGTLIKTSKGLEKIENINEVLSFNFENNKIERDIAKTRYVGKKQIYQIETEKSVINCSGDHRWFVKTANGIELKLTKNIDVNNDKLIIIG